MVLIENLYRIFKIKINAIFYLSEPKAILYK